MTYRRQNAHAMRDAVETEFFHLAILDIAMPGEDGLSLGRWLRSRMPIGIIYATAAGTGASTASSGWSSGADDYMVKPYELARDAGARVRSVLRRVPPTEEAQACRKPAGEERSARVRVLRRFPAPISTAACSPAAAAHPIDMAKSEFDVLEVFLHPAEPAAQPRRPVGGDRPRRRSPESSRAVDIRVMRPAQEDRGRPGQSEIPADGARREATSSPCPTTQADARRQPSRIASMNGANTEPGARRRLAIGEPDCG